MQAPGVGLRATTVQLQERARDLETHVGHHPGDTSRPPSSAVPGSPTHPQSRPSGPVAREAVEGPVTSPIIGPWRVPELSRTGSGCPRNGVPSDELVLRMRVTPLLRDLSLQFIETEDDGRVCMHHRMAIWTQDNKVSAWISEA